MTTIPSDLGQKGTENLGNRRSGERSLCLQNLAEATEQGSQHSNNVSTTLGSAKVRETRTHPTGKNGRRSALFARVSRDHHGADPLSLDFTPPPPRTSEPGPCPPRPVLQTREPVGNRKGIRRRGARRGHLPGPLPARDSSRRPHGAQRGSREPPACVEVHAPRGSRPAPSGPGPRRAPPVGGSSGRRSARDPRPGRRGVGEPRPAE